MLTEKHFRLMKKTAIFINTGRGPTVQEVGADQGIAGKLDRPCRAGRAGNRAAAATTIRSSACPTSRCRAHTASASARFDPARKRHVGRELALVLNGKWPMSCVNPAVLLKSDLRRWQPVSMERGPNS